MMKAFFSSPTSETIPSKSRDRLGERYSRREHESKTEERLTESSTYYGNAIREESEDIAVKVSGSVVTSEEPTKLFSLINKRNWTAVVKRCRGEYAKETMTWVEEKNQDNSLRWKLLPIHLVSS